MPPSTVAIGPGTALVPPLTDVVERVVGVGGRHGPEDNDRERSTGRGRSGYGRSPSVPYDGGVLADPVRPSDPSAAAERPAGWHRADVLDDHLWCGLRAGALPVAGVESWVRRPSTGAVVTFVGTARDHSEGRTGVVELVYEAYERYAVRRMQQVAERARSTWPTVVRVAVLHRTGPVAVGEDAVVVAVSSPHRDEAFPAAAFVIEAVKATAPIWKLERWADGESWSPNCRCADHDTLSEFGLAG